MKKLALLVLVFSLIFVILGLGEPIKYGGTLRFIGGGGWAQFPDSMNPLLPEGGFSPVVAEIYEVLFYVNPLNGNITDLLGTSYEWKNNNLELDINTREGVKWSDGTPFTARDVAFTFNYIKKYPALDQLAVWSSTSGLESVEANGDNIVVFKFSKPNTPLFYYLSNIPIIPEHIWSTIKNPVTFKNENPVGTGPFLFKSSSPQNNVILAVKNPDYWRKGRPYVDKLEIRAVKSNTTSLLMLLRHDADWGDCTPADPKKLWVDKDPELNKMWWPVNNANILYLNTQKTPFDIPEFRKAVALAIDKESLVEKAYHGSCGGVAHPTGIIPSQQNEWLDPLLKDVNLRYSPQKAQELLTSIGFKKNSRGELMDSDGKVLPTYKILVGAGWTDYITMAQIISKNLENLGIKTVIDQEAGSTYMSSIMSGTYDMAICWWAGEGPSPYYYYYQGFYPPFSGSKIGETSLSDYARYTNPIITAALETFSKTSDIHLQKQAIYAIERIIVEDTPLVFLTNRTHFGCFSEAYLVGWPSDSNPYCAAEVIDSPGGAMITVNVHLK
ncbi:MAG: ABC transporter substrate-binding protein [Thermotoga sp.]|nr:MAG: ABC transporter substrate-binding protein [Thermotoga sp.]